MSDAIFEIMFHNYYQFFGLAVEGQDCRRPKMQKAKKEKAQDSRRSKKFKAKTGLEMFLKY